MTARYARQMMLPEIGAQGQDRLRAASVLVVGAGGLGCALLPYLCGAGVGTLVIVDHDRVEEANLHRQPLFRMRDIGRHKALAARDALLQLNPDVRIEALCEPMTPANARRLVAAADVTVDAADSLAVTYALSDACMAARRALVSASVAGMRGYVGAFCGGAPSYRAVFPEPPIRSGACSEIGVLGAAVGVIGTLQAQIVLALVLRLQPMPLGRLVRIELATLRFSEFSFRAAHEPTDVIAPFIAASQVTAEDWLVDLRSREEIAVAPFDADVRIAVERVQELCASVPASDRIVLCCRSGIRAWQAARELRACGHTHLALLALVR